jgi:hypothetical protein
VSFDVVWSEPINTFSETEIVFNAGTTGATGITVTYDSRTPGTELYGECAASLVCRRLLWLPACCHGK